ncbi:hypothetical protein HHI36_020393 [Cryptolaemus montrouzieri]|uniref:Uncharacterized protein n=1 Tax=Cryptolaemus montrouzieri TaxID=559131 RepID=A0ABD2NA48_9CUCU
MFSKVLVACVYLVVVGSLPRPEPNAEPYWYGLGGGVSLGYNAAYSVPVLPSSYQFRTAYVSSPVIYASPAIATTYLSQPVVLDVGVAAKEVVVPANTSSSTKIEYSSKTVSSSAVNATK